MFQTIIYVIVHVVNHLLGDAKSPRYALDGVQYDRSTISITISIPMQINVVYHHPQSNCTFACNDHSKAYHTKRRIHAVTNVPVFLMFA